MISVDPPTINRQPASQFNIVPGNTVSFSVNATGESLEYHWQLDGSPITKDSKKYSGADDATLTMQSVTVNDEGNYAVTVSNPAGYVDSTAAMLTISK